MRPLPGGGGPADVQAADSGFDLLARGRKAQAAGFDIPNPIEDEACLIRVQLAHLQRHDSPGTIGEDAEGQHRLHPEGGGRLVASLLAEEHRVVDACLTGVLLSRVGIVDRDPDDLEAVGRALAAQAPEQRDLPPAGLAPGGPEIYEQRVALLVGEPVGCAVESRQSQLRQHLGDLSRRGCGRGGGSGRCLGGGRPRRRRCRSGRHGRCRTERRARRVRETIGEETAGGARDQHGGSERRAPRAGAAVSGLAVIHGGEPNAARVREAKASAFMYPTTR